MAWSLGRRSGGGRASQEGCHERLGVARLPVGRPRLKQAWLRLHRLGVLAQVRVVFEGRPGALQEEEDDGEADVGEREGAADEERRVGREVALEVRHLLFRLLQAALERRLQTRCAEIRAVKFTG